MQIIYSLTIEDSDVMRSIVKNHARAKLEIANTKTDFQTCLTLTSQREQ